MFDMDSKESGPLETFVGEKRVEKGQRERPENLHLFLCARLNIGLIMGLFPFRNDSRAFI